MLNEKDIYNLKKLKIYSKAVKLSNKCRMKLLSCTIATSLLIAEIQAGITLSIHNSEDALVNTIVSETDLYTNKETKDEFYMPIINGKKIVIDYHDNLKQYNLINVDMMPIKAIVYESSFERVKDTEVYIKTIDTYYLNKKIDLNNFNINNIDGTKETKTIRKVGVSIEELLKEDKLSYITVDQNNNDTILSINTLAFDLAVTLFIAVILYDLSKKNNNKYIELYNSLQIDYNSKDIKEAYNELLYNIYNDQELLDYIKKIYGLQDKSYFKTLLKKLINKREILFVKKLVK